MKTTYTVNNTTFLLEQFIPNSYRVRLTSDGKTSRILFLLNRKPNRNYAPWRANLQGDENARIKYEFVITKSSRNLDGAYDPLTFFATIEEALAAIDSEWLATCDLEMM